MTAISSESRGKAERGGERRSSIDKIHLSLTSFVWVAKHKPQRNSQHFFYIFSCASKRLRKNDNDRWQNAQSLTPSRLASRPGVQSDPSLAAGTCHSWHGTPSRSGTAIDPGLDVVDVTVACKGSHPLLERCPRGPAWMPPVPSSLLEQGQRPPWPMSVDVPQAWALLKGMVGEGGHMARIQRLV